MTTNEHKIIACRDCGVLIEIERPKDGSAFSRRKVCRACWKSIRHRCARSAHEKYVDAAASKMMVCLTCGEAFMSHIRSGKRTYLKTCSEKCAKIRMAESGRKNQPLAVEQLQKAHTKLFERPLKGHRAMGPENQNVKPFALVSPGGDVYRGYNLIDFVRNHSVLFDEKHTAWKPSKRYSKVKSAGYRPSRAQGCLTCAAASGLGSVNRGHRKSWRGWTAHKINNKQEDSKCK